MLEQDDEFKDFNFERLTPDWTSKKGFWGELFHRDLALEALLTTAAPDPVSLRERAKWVRQFLRDRPEKNIVLVAHGDILRNIIGTAQGASTRPWQNAEVRVYNFDPKTVDTDDCFLMQEKDVAAAGGYSATSTEMDLIQHGRL